MQDCPSVSQSITCFSVVNIVMGMYPWGAGGFDSDYYYVLVLFYF